MPVPLSLRASRFLRDCIHSVDELDAILLMHRDPSRWWSAEQIALALGLTPEAAARLLESLAARNLLDVRLGQTVQYCFSPIHDPLFDTVGELAVDPAAARRVVGLFSPKVSRKGGD